MKRHENEFTVIGHRGSGAGVHPVGGVENSRTSFAHAFHASADEVECDLSLSKDGSVVIYHDRKIDGREARRLTRSEIQAAKPGVLDFDRLLDEFPEKKFIFELKSYTDYREIINRIYPFISNNISNNKDIRRFKFLSFSIDALRYVKEIDERLFCSYIATCSNDRFEPFATKRHIQLCVESGIQEIAGHWLGFYPAIIRRAQAAGLEVGLGLINSRLSFRYALRYGARRLYTDRVERLVALIDRY
ncbi:MAG: hypothetical protein B6244_01715 [Candidatus Cloacimonetes bacterium 4572_55]|nr:MAG: hypothetical protein B6244_01715 [Candidatus Cloacimonetes bacterium 4572_55]